MPASSNRTLGHLARGSLFGLLLLSGCHESYVIDCPGCLEGDGSTGDAGVGDTDVDAGPDGGASECERPGARFVTRVVDHMFGTGQDHNQEEGFPEALFGPPRANDVRSVVSLGNGGWVILEFEGNAIVDGPGADFIVFENPLPGFVELATVSVSDDLEHWVEFPCTAPQAGPDYGFCAGVGVVHSHPDNGIDPLDPEVAGGDAFDLADIGVERARYVRIHDRPDLDGPAGVFDLDAVAIVNARCP